MKLIIALMVSLGLSFTTLSFADTTAAKEKSSTSKACSCSCCKNKHKDQNN